MMNIQAKIKSLREVIAKIRIAHQHSLFTDEANTEHLNTSLRAWRKIKRDGGYLRSLIEGQCVNFEGDAIPWYTYPAIEQLSKWNLSNLRILEYGCGNSTLWWAARAASVTSIETSTQWYEAIRSKMPDNCSLILKPLNMDGKDSEQINDYVNIVNELGKFDVIIIDGCSNGSLREKCTHQAINHLADGGFMIIDNSDWLPKSCKFARDAGLLEVDFSGLSPLNDYMGTTSLFFCKTFRPKPISEVHPGNTIGGYEWDWETTPKGW